ncbi:MAG: valine--tRNA ligase [Gammaproteobacteria bacterium]|nr:valine--tRNA ligase [Gammaproteobacteria bacterium]
MQKTYDPKTIESHWYPLWEKEGYFKPRGTGKPYCIPLPPPNVTGVLHMGHGFQQTLMDILIRYHRMMGDKVLWQGGTDHAGIATQMVVERNLLLENISRHEIGREAFVEKIWEWKKNSGDQITKQMRRLGLSIDWSRERFTLDQGLSDAVNTVFIKLHEEGLIYRGQRLVNWDPKLLTAVSDLEVEYTEEEGFLWYIHYPLAHDTTQHLTIATTRPETLLGDVALAVNPKDERYQSFIGHSVLVPISHRNIPIIADDFVDPAFGTGVVKITPAHDFNDYAIAQRHQLPLLNILTPQASLNENVPPAYQGLDRFVARKKIIEDLKKENLFAKEEKHRLKIPRGDRSHDIIEPYLTDQWFVKIAPLGEPALDVVKKGKIQFVPDNWSNTYFHWMENLQDWCISRQLWWGHRIPAWYDEKGNIYVGKNEKDVREKHHLPDSLLLNQDNDVLDTWFSSALWPFSTLGWPQKTDDLKTFYPSNVLITGFDIIFFWVARMIMFGLKFMDNIPFHHVYIHGLIRDAEGQKMSKTKGNVLDPLDIIDGIDLATLTAKRTQGLMQPAMAKRIEEQTKRHYPNGIPSLGTDALRFTFCSLASTTRDINFDLARVEGYRNFCNKLWNAARFVFLNIEKFPAPQKPVQFNFVDRYILAQLQQTISACHTFINEYRFDLFANTLYEFVWNEFCDWYLEFAKPILTHENEKQTHEATRYTLVFVLDQIVRLLHPIMPFITEEIWQKTKTYLPQTETSIMLSAYPEVDSSLIDPSAIENANWLKEIITSLRTLRSQSNISPGKQITVYVISDKSENKARLEQFKPFIMTLARLTDLIWHEDAHTLPASITGLANGMTLFVPMSDFIDKIQEQQRLEKEISKLETELLRCQTKLSNPAYVEKAPVEIVKKEKERAQSLIDDLSKLRAQIESVKVA